MSETTLIQDPLPFFVTGPGGIDGLLIVVALVLILVLLGFGALYFTINALPDRMASGLGKVQMQVVGILGLLSLFTMNNLYWVAALLLAAIPVPDLLNPLNQIARGLARRSTEEEAAPPETEMDETGKEGEACSN